MYILIYNILKKAFDKMSPQMIYPLLRKLGAPPTLVTAIKHLYDTRIMTFKNSTAKVQHTEYRTLLMQGGSLGPTMYKCLKLGVMLSLRNEDVWTNDWEIGAQPYKITNDFSHTLKRVNPNTYTWNNEITLLLIMFADDMQLYFESRHQLETGASEFIKHLQRWGLHVHVAENLHKESKSTVMYIQGMTTAAAEAKQPLKVPGGWIRFVEKYKFLGSIITSDLKIDEEITNRTNAMLANLHQYKDAISSKHLSINLRKLIVRVCLDESLLYGSEALTLTANHIKQYDSARLCVLRTMKNITAWDQHIHHISGKRILKEFKMATCAEKIRRRAFGFWKKIICNASLDSPERMLMGKPYLLWNDDIYQPDARKSDYATTMTTYLEERALQLYYYTEGLGKSVDFDHRALIKKLLCFTNTQSDRTNINNWMQLAKNSTRQWEWVVKYGQFEPIETPTTEQELRRKRQNTFAPEVPQPWIMQRGGRAAVRTEMRQLT